MVNNVLAIINAWLQELTPRPHSYSALSNNNNKTKSKHNNLKETKMSFKITGHTADRRLYLLKLGCPWRMWVQRGVLGWGGVLIIRRFMFIRLLARVR